MFFIAFFGIQDKYKQIGSYNNIICPSCGRLGRYDIHKAYRYLHIFFVPTFRWNIRYLVKTSCCGTIYELDSDVGRAFEKNPDTEIKAENLHRIYSHTPFKYCSNCKTDVPSEYSFCPYCGGKL